MPRAEDLMRSLLPRLRRDLFNDTQFFSSISNPTNDPNAPRYQTSKKGDQISLIRDLMPESGKPLNSMLV